jgi:anti-anti-sigma factor
MTASAVEQQVPTTPTTTGPPALLAARGQSRSAFPGLCGDIQVAFEPEGPVLWLRGEVDAAVVDDFGFRWTASPLPLIAIDAGEATFVDSSAVSLLVRWARAASMLGSTAVLRRSSPRLDRVLELMGLTDVFTRSTSPTLGKHTR